MLTKADEWSYEKEWRILTLESSNQLVDVPGKTKSIIFGLRMPLEDRELIMSRLNDDIKYKEIKIVEGTFRLEVVNFTG